MTLFCTFQRQSYTLSSFYFLSLKRLIVLIYFKGILLKDTLISYQINARYRLRRRMFHQFGRFFEVIFTALVL